MRLELATGLAARMRSMAFVLRLTRKKLWRAKGIVLGRECPRDGYYTIFHAVKILQGEEVRFVSPAFQGYEKRTRTSGRFSR
jgi:hypothetical protein